LSGAGVQDPWHGLLKKMYLLCDEAQQVGCLQVYEGCPLVQVAGMQSQFAIVVDGKVNEAGVSTAAPDRNTVLCC